MESALSARHFSVCVCLSVCVCMSVCSFEFVFTLNVCDAYYMRVCMCACVQTRTQCVWYAEDGLILSDKAAAQEFTWLLLHSSSHVILDFHDTA